MPANSSQLSSFDRIYSVVRNIPKGKVATYGQIARMAGNPKWSRVVGYALHKNPDPKHIPCYRVVTKAGELSSAFAFGGIQVQRILLAADGIQFDHNGNVIMSVYQWKPDENPF
jgi:methylated-DNA-protein-cysteine methyltransferase-like protein